MLTTNLCRFSICFLHDRQQNGNVKRSEFVEFEQMFEISRYLSQELSDVVLNISPHKICQPFQCLFCKECKFLPDHEYSSPGGKKQMLIYAYFADSHVCHQYGIFGGKSQTSFSRNATRAGSEEGRLFS